MLVPTAFILLAGAHTNKESRGSEKEAAAAAAEAKNIKRPVVEAHAQRWFVRWTLYGQWKQQQQQPHSRVDIFTTIHISHKQTYNFLHTLPFALYSREQSRRNIKLKNIYKTTTKRKRKKNGCRKHHNR